MKYQRRPVTVDAVQYLPGVNDTEVSQFLEGCTGWQQGDNTIRLPSFAGPLYFAYPSDYIIRNAAGVYYPCRAVTFRVIYEAVTEPEEQPYAR